MALLRDIVVYVDAFAVTLIITPRLRCRLRRDDYARLLIARTTRYEGER